MNDRMLADVIADVIADADAEVMRYLKIYSKAEIVLADHFGFKNLIEKNDVEPLTLYRMMADKAFMSDDRTEYAAAVRKGILAMNAQKPLRHTPPFEALITVEKPVLEPDYPSSCHRKPVCCLEPGLAWQARAGVCGCDCHH